MEKLRETRKISVYDDYFSGTEIVREGYGDSYHLPIFTYRYRPEYYCLLWSDTVTLGTVINVWCECVGIGMEKTLKMLRISHFSQEILKNTN